MTAASAEPATSVREQAAPKPVPVVLDSGSLRGIAVSIHICAMVLATAAFYFARVFFLPVFLSILFALTLLPIVRWLAHRGVPAAVSAVALVVLLALVLGFGGYALSGPVARWINEAPRIGAQIETKLSGLRGSVEAVAKATKQVEEISKSASDPSVREVVVREPGLLSSATSTLWGGITITGVALVLVLFLLASGGMVYEKIIRVLPTLSDKKKALHIVHDIEDSISRYLLTVTLINIGLGVAIGLVLWVIGMPNPLLWGVGATLLNFLPYVGAATGIVLTAIVAFVSLEPTSYALLAPIAYLACAVLEGNVVTPLILGRRLELNTIAILLAIAFWGWVWGLVGVFMAVPILVVMKVFCDHFPRLAAFGEFLSAERPKLDDEDESLPRAAP